ncbi:hypothetical protein JCGZ_21213 [Jatropha curcas]|uniref:Senescence regulator n=1 Tax=Jatropha curcas TaxID=180498 RepID=A0A067JAG9_JATCU|nr:uncharacterized protein LOC105649328 [Jatropha curcas]XP_020541267.1 uncharacterized protein LOC105649328 [Jatropha curcas]KDP20742.1 hypothetical protein JCGZ_21213 [Jatropha curcas]
MAEWKVIMGNASSGDFSRRSLRDEDFEEEDIWSVMKEREDSNPKMRKSKDYYSSASSSSSSWRVHAAPRMIPAAEATILHEAQAVEQSSAPVKIPDWSKIYGKTTKMGSWAEDRTDHDPVNGPYNDADNENDDGEGMVPPHEWIAKKLARSQISSFSVCEGIGRTLKGRDLSKVRNAILTKTGFLE